MNKDFKMKYRNLNDKNLVHGKPDNKISDKNRSNKSPDQNKPKIRNRKEKGEREL